MLETKTLDDYRMAIYDVEKTNNYITYFLDFKEVKIQIEVERFIDNEPLLCETFKVYSLIVDDSGDYETLLPSNVRSYFLRNSLFDFFNLENND